MTPDELRALGLEHTANVVEQETADTMGWGASPGEFNKAIAELLARIEELTSENTDLRTSLDAKGFIARWQEAENMGYQCGRSHAERDLFIAEKTAEAEKQRADEAADELDGALTIQAELLAKLAAAEAALAKYRDAPLGGNGAHWRNCHEVHIDCCLATLAEADEKLERSRERGDDWKTLAYKEADRAEQAEQRAKWWKEYANETEDVARWAIDREREDLAGAEQRVRELEEALRLLADGRWNVGQASSYDARGFAAMTLARLTTPEPKEET